MFPRKGLGNRYNTMTCLCLVSSLMTHTVDWQVCYSELICFFKIVPMVTFLNNGLFCNPMIWFVYPVFFVYLVVYPQTKAARSYERFIEATAAITRLPVHSSPRPSDTVSSGSQRKPTRRKSFELVSAARSTPGNRTCGLQH